jgi:uncharacterized protein YndB with AHSA1/START domain
VSIRVTAEAHVAADPDTAFRVFVERIREWWHVDGPYWNDAGRRVGMRMEPGPAGRLVEVYEAATGQGFEIGRIVGWQPGRRLAFLWRQANWQPDESTEVELLFEASEPGTRVALEHIDWERVASDPTASEGYREGWDELLDWYADVVSKS